MEKIIQNTPQWIAFRRKKIGASDASAILEISPWKTPFQLWEDKMGISENTTSFVMQRGHDLEEKARECFCKMLNITVQPEVMIHPDYPWMIASMDGINIQEKIAVEIKCPGKEDHQTCLSGKMPEKYYPQLQHQLAVSGLPHMYYFSFDGENGCSLKVERDDIFISDMVEKEKKFYEHIQNLTPPKMIDRDFYVREDEKWNEISKEWIHVYTELKRLEKKEDGLRQALITLSADRNSKGNGIRLSKNLRKGAIDFTQIAEVEGLDLERYRKPHIKYWKISIA